MYLHKSKRKDGRIYLSIVHGYRDQGKHRTKTIRSLGYLDELEKQYDDPVSHFEKVKDELDQERQASENPVQITLHPKQKIKSGEALRKNFGFCALSAIYHELGIDSFLENRQTKRRLEYSLNSVMKLLVFGRVVKPASKLATWEDKESYFDRFDFSLDDTYRALPIFAGYRDQLTLHLHNKVKANYGRKDELAYYDVTNYYFEIDEADDLRKKGVSKEHRPDPIVSMGLLMDSNSLPITYKLSPGNTNDCETLIPVLTEVKKSFSMKRIVVVGDKAMNCSDNICALVAREDGYVFSKSVRGGSEELKEWACDGRGYKQVGEDAYVKSRIEVRTLAVTVEAADKKAGKKKKTKRVKVTEKQVCVYSGKYDRRAKAKRQPAIDKAKALIGKPSKLDSMLDKSAARYIEGVSYDQETGEVIEATARVLGLNETRIAEEERLDGYYVISTSEVDKSDSEILDVYKGLWKIEESFKVTKADLGARPVYLSNRDCIEAHFLICFISLLIVRILEMKTSNRHPAPTLINSIRKACGTHIGENWYRFDFYDDALDDIGKALDIDFTKLNLRTGDIRKIVASSKKA